MIRITLSYVWQIAEHMEALGRLSTDQKLQKSDLSLECFEAASTLEALLQGSVFSPVVRSSRRLGEDLLKLLREAITADGKSDSEADTFLVWRIRSAYNQFKIDFLAEFGMFHTYFVTPKGSHDTLMLLEWPQSLFPEALARKSPEAMFDVGEAGKALCYEMSTACGYHLFRAVEAVLRRYYTQVTGGHPQPKVRNIAVYINAMRQKKCGDEKVLSVVEQLSKLHRNPLAHPEAILTLDEALSIAGMARSAITAMMAVLPDVPPTTTP